MWLIYITRHSSVFRWKEIWTHIAKKDEPWRLNMLREISQVERYKSCIISLFIGPRLVQFTDTENKRPVTRGWRRQEGVGSAQQWQKLKSEERDGGNSCPILLISLTLLICMLKNRDTITHVYLTTRHTQHRSQCLINGLYQKKHLESRTVSSEAQKCQQTNSPSPLSFQSGRLLSWGWGWGAFDVILSGAGLGVQSPLLALAVTAFHTHCIHLQHPQLLGHGCHVGISVADGGMPSSPGLLALCQRGVHLLQRP